MADNVEILASGLADTDFNLFAGEYLEIDDSNSGHETEYNLTASKNIAIRIQLGNYGMPVAVGSSTDIIIRVFVQTSKYEGLLSAIIGSFPAGSDSVIMTVPVFSAINGDKIKVHARSDNANDTSVTCFAWITSEVGDQTAILTGINDIKGTGFAKDTHSLPQCVAGSIGGSGAIEESITVTDTEGTPIDNVSVWISEDEAGDNVIAGTLYTNPSGVVTFMLDAGSYYCWKEKSGFNFVNPQTFTVS